MFKQLLFGEKLSTNEQELVENCSEEEIKRLKALEKPYFWFLVYPIFMLLGVLPLLWFLELEDSKSLTDWIIVSGSILLMTALIRLVAFFANQSVKRSIGLLELTKNREVGEVERRTSC